MRRFATLILLAACTPAPEPVDLAAGLPSFRDRTQPIASKALFDPARFDGNWQVVARYPTPFEEGCVAAAFTFQGSLAGFVCAGADGQTLHSATGTVQVQDLGRLSLRLSDPARPGVAFPARAFWILWADDGYRTAVIGTPDGRAGWILNRSAQIPADRRVAAREILDFNGYDLTQLQGVGP